ncbi:hypothetical protein [Pseudonocardia sp. GCM10023141]|uniref:hypothetical protein n=1 Tax=Pseudonocardia sp. GCM10023141 TaxID=3252653 RepID=UPI0036D29FC5
MTRASGTAAPFLALALSAAPDPAGTALVRAAPVRVVRRSSRGAGAAATRRGVFGGVIAAPAPQ